VAAPLVLAHRGANRVAPENTLAAFEAGLAMGADGVELDVHRSADGALVVHHDATVADLGLLAGLPLAAIRAARPDLPTLGEALDVCRGRLVNVEIKNSLGDADHDPSEAAAALVVDLLRARDGRDEVVVSSFSLETVDRVRALDPAVATAFLTVRTNGLTEALQLAHEHGHDALNPRAHALVGPRAAQLTSRARELGMRIYVWTVNDERQIRRLAAAGVDGLITDVPDVAVRALGR
jgi:glycerophosphoryl diester phosphodiesterase